MASIRDSFPDILSSQTSNIMLQGSLYNDVMDDENWTVAVNDWHFSCRAAKRRCICSRDICRIYFVCGASTHLPEACAVRRFATLMNIYEWQVSNAYSAQAEDYFNYSSSV